MPRIDMTGFARELSEHEESGCAWNFDDIEALEPRLKLSGAAESKISRREFHDRLASYLVSHENDAR
jgi:hypothetical protein